MGNENNSLYIYLEKSVSEPLYKLFQENEKFFTLTQDPEKAALIIFENDRKSYIEKSVEFLKWSYKCFVVSESDVPSYYLPACYASNRKGILSNGRAKTIPYLISQRKEPNSYVSTIKNIDPRKYLYSFIGGSTCWTRKKIFKKISSKEDVHIENSDNYHHWNTDVDYLEEKESRKKRYAEVLENSMFVLCPRGAGVSSIRLFEVMQAGRIPVIISDKWVPITNVPWNEFSVFIRENQLIRLDKILREKKQIAAEFGERAQYYWNQLLSPSNDSYLLYQCLLEIKASRKENRETIIRSFYPFMERYNRIVLKTMELVKYCILKTFQTLHIKFPYTLNRPIEEQLKKLKSTKA